MVRIHGRLAGAAVGELQRVCREAPGSLVLDVTYLVSADDLGLATLRGLVGDGAHLGGVSPYLALLLEGERSSESGRGEEGQRHA